MAEIGKESSQLEFNVGSQELAPFSDESERHIITPQTSDVDSLMAAINHNGGGSEINYIVHKHDLNLPDSLMATAENGVQFELKNEEETLTGDDLNSSKTKQNKKKAVEFTKVTDNVKHNYKKHMAGIPTNINVQPIFPEIGVHRKVTS